ncbi:NAD(P)-dependent oxidoreductase [Rhizobium sp. BK379]|uniref:NAD(P)-dependent oxidoreductase n=1 Tax=Rhizobium sp. BK379 TaxID=2587059 RepID=UPI000DDB9954|nr:NAD(P)-dependent oxidoreductase [Rhizobium sp. BK379]MBB3446796.1 phosphoglycerate dehydrogenase-like enzyme [Rhizobium sp. BK379]
MRIVFSGHTFPDMPDYLKRSLAGDHEILLWDGELATMPSKIDILIPRAQRIGAVEMDRGNVKFIQQFGVGLDGVDLAAARCRGIPVANVPGTGGNADSVAEHAILLLLMLLRQCNKVRENIRDGILGAPIGTALAGRSVCLYGLGAVAKSLAKRLKAFDVRLLGLTRAPSAGKASEYHLDRCYSAENAEACLSQSDILIVCVKHTSETTGLVQEQHLRWLRPGAVLINIARAGLIDRKGLEACIADGQLGGVGLDVFWTEPADALDPLLAHPNVIMTPHVAGITDRSLADIARAVAENIERFAVMRPLLNTVD